MSYPGENYHHHATNTNGYPQQQQQQQQQQGGYYPPPPGPPAPQGGGYYPQQSAGYQGGGFPPPTGPPPPPMNRPSEYTRYQVNSGPYGPAGQGYQAPTGQFVASSYQTGSAGANPMQQTHFAPPSGPPPQAPPTGSQHFGPQFQAQGGQVQQPFFQYSQCTGRKKGLCIGINYRGTSSELRGCINDAQNVQRFICQRFGYKPEDIVMLTDDAANPRQIPTRANMIAAMQWLVRDAQPNDSLFFHYSGHGGQTPDLDGDEDDGNDEVIYPLDHKTAGFIVDDDIHTIMVKPLPPGCRLTAIFDSCHSGTAMDLPYIYSTEGKIKEPNLLAEAGQGLMSAGMSYLRGDIGGMFSGVMGLGKQIMNQNSGAAARTKQTKTSAADVISWSGCKDSQTSADTQEAGKATGAMSYAFIAALTRYPQQSYMQLLNTIRDELRGKYDQKPQLSASHPMDCNLLFIA